MDRVAILEGFIARAPDDPFPRYGLAMELHAQGRTDESLAAFDELARRAPDYLPTYLMYGNALAAAGRTDEAALVYRRGIALAEQKRDGKTGGELEAALAALG